MGEGAYFQHLVDTHSKEDMAKALYRIMEEKKSENMYV